MPRSKSNEQRAREAVDHFVTIERNVGGREVGREERQTLVLVITGAIQKAVVADRKRGGR